MSFYIFLHKLQAEYFSKILVFIMNATRTAL
jgi:hypothetical protein